jgi:hypothetical protein
MARSAGLWYLAMALIGPIGIMVVPSQILVQGDAAATAANIAANEWLLRVGIVSSLICQICFVFLVLALDRLFAGVHDRYAKLMVSLVIAAAPIAIVNELFQVAALELGTGAVYAAAIPEVQRNALVLALLNVHHSGIAIAGVFWGLWLFPFGMLVIRSGFIPRVLGVLLIAGCFSYLVDSAIALLVPQYRSVLAGVLMLPLALGEFGSIFWLLIKGVRVARPGASPVGD